MIIVRLNGGMGNQMFQYAYGKSLSHKLSTEVFYDNRYLLTHHNRKYNTKRNFDLDLFDTKIQIAEPKMLEEIPTYFGKKKKIILKLKRRLNIPTKIGNLSYIPEVNNYKQNIQIPEHSYIDGYWQDERYFESVKHQIKNDFILKEKPNAKISEIENYIRNRDSVVIQIRRTDYIANPINKLIFNSLDVDYFRQGLEILKQTLHNPIVLIFSDDNQWALDNFKFINIENILIEDEWKGDRYQYSMYLMNKAKNFIISNSSFGWWGAYLSQFENKKIIAPKKWFRYPLFNSNFRLPKDWIKI